MEIPANAVELVKRWEGLHKLGKDGLVYPYRCPALVWTIGYGSTRLADGQRVTHSTPPLSPDACEELMSLELGRCIQQAIRLSPILASNQDALGAIGSFIFNLGQGNYKASTLRRRINEENMDLAQREILKWVYAGGKRLPGLYARRLAESRFLRPKETEEAPAEYYPDWLRFWEPRN